ncbi:MAG: Hsp20 family protein [Candidatus Jacksonbacteria bacterium]|nr:Hsp20 family protein [Candidatus Jacksonbacteria bacterium]
MQNQFPNFQKEFGISFKHGAFPKVDVVDYDDCVVIVAEMPSMEKELLNIDVEDGVLTMSGDKHQLEDDDARYIVRELKHSSFKRSFELGDNLSSDISAKFENGVLRIEIPKREKEESTKRSINIY